MTPTEADTFLAKVLSPWVRALEIKTLEVTEKAATLRLPFSPAFRQAGGAVAPQVLMAAADTAMMVAVAAVLGSNQPMLAVSLTTTLLTPVRKGDINITARIVRHGQGVAVGEIDLTDDHGTPAAHVAATYALPERPGH